jgi:hypothetical protein
MENKVKVDFGSSYHSDVLSPLQVMGMSIASDIAFYLYKSLWWAFVYGLLGWSYVAYKLIEKYDFFPIN